MSTAQHPTPSCKSFKSRRLNRDEIRLINCYRSLTSRDRYAMRCLVFAYEEMNKLHCLPR